MTTEPVAPDADETVDVVIVGAGPAGMTVAAGLLARSELTVAVIDAGHEVGGQYWRQPPAATGPGALTPGELADLHHDLPTYAALRRRITDGVAAGRVRLHLGHHAWAVEPSGAAYVVKSVDRTRPGRERGRTVRGSTLVIATGAYDRALPFPGWDLPGVMTAGGLQALLKANGVAAGTRVVVGGTGPFLLPVAAGLASRGAKVTVVEANRPTRWLAQGRAVLGSVGKLTEGMTYAAQLLRARVPVRVGRVVVEAHGTDRVEAVSTARLDRAGRVVPGTVVREPADAVGVGWGFTPQLDLAVTLGLDLAPAADGTPVIAVDGLQRASLPGVVAAGETTGVGGAALAVAEGRLAAFGILADRCGLDLDPAEVGAVEREVARARAFARAMALAHPVPVGWTDSLRPGTTFCRCEEVRCAAVTDALEQGAGDARQVKQLTRTGMGWCQGRVCGFAAALISEGGPGSPVERLVSAPVPLGVVARRETGGDSTPSGM